VSPTAAVARAHGRATGTSLPGDEFAARAARRFLRAALAEWADPFFAERVVDDGTLLVSELVTNAVVHAGTAVELVCRLDPAESALVLEVTDRHPARALRADRDAAPPGASAPADLAHERAEDGRGLHLVATLADTWGVTYRRDRKTVWCRIALTGEPEPEVRIPAQLLAPSLPSLPRRADPDWAGHGPLSFLAEASDLLAGQLDEDNVASLATQLLVPRLADWCAVWLHPGGAAPRLAHVWHSAEQHLDGLRAALEQAPPAPSDRPGAQPYPWPGDGTALAVPLIATGRCHGTLLLGAAARGGLPDGALGLVEDFARRVALALGTARQYARQAMISTVLQRGLLPPATGRIPGVEHAVVYEPTAGDWVGGDFYDLFPAGDGRWCFALGDVCGSGPEAASLAGIARPVLRLLAREGCGVSDVLDRLNRALADEAATALLAETAAWEGQARFLSLLYGEITPGAPGRGAQVTLASAGHPLPLLLAPDGTVRAAATPQMLLGISDDARYASESFGLAPGDTLLCVTDGVTERRHAGRQFDDDDGLAAALQDCVGLPAGGIAERLRKAVHEFDEAPPADDLALLVLQAL
jgi:serine phosphatase RsbU (regulator of sigma subunit)/anti-sigma regulatory factor (Ser/Thr protein kinase)